jgi:hypothetical protein
MSVIPEGLDRYSLEERSRGEKELEDRLGVLGPDHPDTLVAKHELASTLAVLLGDFAGARALYEQVLEVRLRILGPDHPRTCSAMIDLADTLARQQDSAGARALYEQVLETHRRVFGPEHRDTLNTMLTLARHLSAQGDLTLYSQLLEIHRRVNGMDYRTLFVMKELAGVLKKQGDLAGANALYEEEREATRQAITQFKQKREERHRGQKKAEIVEIDSESPVTCPHCSMVLLDPGADEEQLSHCKHVLFIYANGEAFEYIDPALEARIEEAEEKAEEEDDALDTWEFLEYEAGANVIFEQVQEDMACGPTKFTVWFGIVANPQP